MSEVLQTKCLITARSSDALAEEVKKDIEDSKNESTEGNNGRDVSDELSISDDRTEE
jgi:hypothetical protein